MAEAIGLIASVIQVAGAGLKLSQTLYQYADGVATADRRIKDIAKEIQLTSFVIEELGDVFKHDETSTLMSKNAVKTANETMKECSSVFAEIDATLKKSKKNTLGRLMLPFRDNKIELLRNHIDKLKSTLQLLMQVLTHAHQVATKKLDREAEAKQKAQIQELIELKKQSTKKYEESLRNISLSDGSTMIDPDEVASDKEDLEDESVRDLTMAAAAIGSTITSKTLATCVQHIRSLLDDIENLQQALTTKVDGDDHSEHHQSLIGSYFRARGHLDSVLFSGSQAQNNGSNTYQGSLSTTSLRSIDVQVDKTGSTLNEGLSEQVTLTDGESIDVSQGTADSKLKAGPVKPEVDLDEPDANRKSTWQEVPKTGQRDGNIEGVRKAPIKLQDNSGRMYSLPYHTCATWELMRNRLVRIYKGTGVRERQLGDGHFDVLDSDGYAILDEDWEDTIEPGMSLKVRFWTINPPFGVGSDMGKRDDNSTELRSAYQGRDGYSGFDDSRHTVEKEENEKQVRFLSGDANSRSQERADPRSVEIEKDRAETRERLRAEQYIKREESARRRDLRQPRLSTISKKRGSLKTEADAQDDQVKDESEMESPVPGSPAWQSRTEEILTRPDIQKTATATKSGDSTESLDRYSTTSMDADSVSETPAQAREQNRIRQQERGYGQHSPAIAAAAKRPLKHKSTFGLSLGDAALSRGRGKEHKSEGSLPPLSTSATPMTNEFHPGTPPQRPYSPEPERESPTPSRRATLAPILGLRPGIQVNRGSDISENSNREGRDSYRRLDKYNGRDGYEVLEYAMPPREDAKQTLSETGRPRRSAAPTFSTEEYAGARHQFASTTPFSQFSDTPIEHSEAAADTVVPEQEKILNSSKDGADKLKIWQATRATSAAPFHFDMTVADTEHDPYKVLSKPTRQDQSDQTRTEALQAEIDATVAIMHENINRVSERGERLDSLQDKTDNLAASAVAFRRAANQQQSSWTWGNPLAWLTTPFTSPAPLAEIAETSRTLVSETTKASKITTGIQSDAIEISVPGSASEALVLRPDEKLSASQSGSSQANDSHSNALTPPAVNVGLINLVSSKKPKRRGMETAPPPKDDDERSSTGTMTGLEATTAKDAKPVGFSYLPQKATASETPNRPVRRLDGPPFYRFNPPLVTGTGKAQLEDNGSPITDIPSTPGQAHGLPSDEGASSVSGGHSPPFYSKEDRDEGRSLQLLTSGPMIQTSESSSKGKEKVDALHASDPERPSSPALRDIYHKLPLSTQQKKQRVAERQEMKRLKENERQVLWERESEGRAAASQSRRMERSPPVINSSKSRRPRVSRRASITMTPAQQEEQRRLLAAELGQMQGERRAAVTRDQGERTANPFQQQEIGYYNPRTATRPDRDNKSQDEASSSGSKTAQQPPGWLTRRPSEFRRIKKGRMGHDGTSPGLKELRTTRERSDRNDPFLADPKKSRTLGGNSDEDIEISPVGPKVEDYFSSEDSSAHASPAPSPPIAQPKLSSDETGMESLVRPLRPKEVESPSVPEPAFDTVPIAVERNVIRTPADIMKAREEREEALEKRLRKAEEERWRFAGENYQTVEAGSYTPPTSMRHKELDLELDLSDRAMLGLFQPFKPSMSAPEQPQSTAPDFNSHSGIRTPQMIMEQRRKREEAGARVKVNDGSGSKETRYASAFKPRRPVAPLPSSSHLSLSSQELPQAPDVPNIKAEGDPLYQEMMTGLAGGESSSVDAKEDVSGDEDEVDALLKDWTTVF